MNLFTPIKIATIAIASLGLTACIDANIEVAVLGENLGEARTTISMDTQFYEIGKAQNGSDDFCGEDEGVFEANDTVVTCTTILSGDFAALMEEVGENDGPEPTITLVSPGLVRVTFPTGSLAEEIGAGDFVDDEETKQMVLGMFEGRAITLVVSGGAIVDTNMTVSADGQSASIVIPFTQLILGTLDLPDESFAVVQLN